MYAHATPDCGAHASLVRCTTGPSRQVWLEVQWEAYTPKAVPFLTQPPNHTLCCSSASSTHVPCLWHNQGARAIRQVSSRCRHVLEKLVRGTSSHVSTSHSRLPGWNEWLALVPAVCTWRAQCSRSLITKVVPLMAELWACMSLWDWAGIELCAHGYPCGGTRSSQVSSLGLCSLCWILFWMESLTPAHSHALPFNSLICRLMAAHNKVARKLPFGTPCFQVFCCSIASSWKPQATIAWRYRVEAERHVGPHNC